ncbi:MAG: PilZ domain-containing protein [Actinomycetota bacterium]|nr:PilZ domain-containing protein [Actinomycetota bacterium]
MSVEPAITLPASGQEVRLRLADFNELCEVLASDEQRLTLAVALHQEGEGEVVFSHARGVVALVGRVQAGAECASFRILGQRRLTQRRDAFRVSLARSALVSIGGRAAIEAVTADLSVRGVRLIVGCQPPLEREVRVELDLGGDKLWVTGVVVRHDHDGFALAFRDLQRPDDERISRFLMEAQRQRLRRS